MNDVRSSRKRILIVCGGNTCRSPMAKAISEQKLKAQGRLDEFEIDSAAYDGPTHSAASSGAREAIKRLFGQDLLASHKSKKLTPEMANEADIVLVMTKRMKAGLPPEKTWTLKEFAGSSGDVADPFSRGLDTYLMCAAEISSLVDMILPKL